MTERKPDNVSWESWIERQIQDGQRDGAFDQLPGRGRPIAGIGTVHDDMWWAKAKLRDEDIDYLPPTIAIRAERFAAIEAATRAPNEARARAILAEVNSRIRYVNTYATSGPPSTTMTIDVEDLLERRRALSPPELPATTPVDDTSVESRSDRWWQRAWRRRRRRAMRSLRNDVDHSSGIQPAVRRERRTGDRRRRRGQER